MCARRFRPEILLAALLLGAFAARAEDVIYGPDGAPTVVQRKLYSMSGKWEASLLFDIAMNTALVDQLGGVVGVSWHPNEWLDVGLEGLFHKTSLSSLALNVRADLRARTRTPLKDEFANDNQLRAGGFGVVRLSPIYGKFNLASEVSVHFQAFLLAGAGIASVHRESVNLCADAASTSPAPACTNFQQTDSTRFTGDVGGGFRFYFGQRWSLTTEVRGYFFPSSYKEANDLTQPGTGTPKSYLAGIATFDAGLSLLF